MIEYSPEGYPIFEPDGKVLWDFMQDRSHVSLCQGPIGSGTSSACMMKIFMEAESRTGRYPAEKDGGSNWHGVIGDFNAADETHWIPQMLGQAPLPDDMPDEEKALMKWPETWRFFLQPPALTEIHGPDGRVVDYMENPLAENLKNLAPGYYKEKRFGKTKAWIDSHMMNKVIFFNAGDPVWPNFNAAYHMSGTRMEYVPGYDVLVSCDFGYARPCAVIAQEIGEKVQVQHEVRSYGGGCLLYTSPSPRDRQKSRMPSSA